MCSFRVTYDLRTNNRTLIDIPETTASYQLYSLNYITHYFSYSKFPIILQYVESEVLTAVVMKCCYLVGYTSSAT
jgi:hypothetical protein